MQRLRLKAHNPESCKGFFKKGMRINQINVSVNVFVSNQNNQKRLVFRRGASVAVIAISYIFKTGQRSAQKRQHFHFYSVIHINDINNNENHNYYCCCKLLLPTLCNLSVRQRRYVSVKKIAKILS
jgi:hypothetical protein